MQKVDKTDEKNVNLLVNSDSSVTAHANGRGELVYEKPVLICYGDVRDITLGPTPGVGESGCEFARRPGDVPDCP